MSSKGKCSRYSEDIFPAFTEPKECKLRRSQRILEKNSQKMDSACGENYLGKVEATTSSSLQTNYYSTEGATVPISTIDDSTPDFTFLSNLEDATADQNSYQFDLLSQYETECAIDLRAAVKVESNSTVELEYSSMQFDECIQKSFNDENMHPQVQNCIRNDIEEAKMKATENDSLIVLSSGSFEIRQSQLPRERLINNYAADSVENDGKTKARGRQKRNPSMHLDECVQKSLKDENMHPQHQNCRTDIEEAQMKPLEKDSVIVISSESCEVLPSQLTTEKPINSYAGDERPSKCDSFAQETAPVSGSKSKKRAAKNPQSQQKIKGEPKSASKRKAAKLPPPSSKGGKRIKVEESAESMLLSQNYVAPKVVRYFNSCPNRFPYELAATQSSLLPAVYPPHFSQQIAMAPQAAIQPPSYFVPTPSAPAAFLTPENSQILVAQQEFEPKRSPSSTASLSIGSVAEFFEIEELDEILNTEKVIYHLTEMHVRSLALALNRNAEELFSLIDRIVELDSNVLRENFASNEAVGFSNDI